MLLLLLLVPGVFAAQEEQNNLVLRVDPPYFSPNKDNLQDQIFFHPVLKTSVDVTRWWLDISELGHKRAVRLTGAGLPSIVKWDGLDKKGDVVPDGLYIAKMEVIGKKSYSTQTQFIVDTRPPEVNLTVSTTVFDKASLGTRTIDFAPYIFDSSPIDRWMLQIVDTSGRTVFVHWSSGPVHSISWDGTDESTKVLVPQGTYRCILDAWDKAGNESALAFADLSVNVTAREMLEQALHRIQVNETPLGLVVQIDAKDLFVARKKKIEMTEEGAARLREVGILINAYPDVPVKIDGYSKTKKSAAFDQSVASIYSWRVYSYLIKIGNVKASRLTVRGRGRSAMFERRAISLPFIRNGVEIILEGNREW